MEDEMTVYNYGNKKQLLLRLKAKVKGLAAEAAKTRELIRKSRGKKRHLLWHTKRFIGTDARYHLLAYGLLRGIPYEKMEPKTSDLGNFDFNYLLSIMHGHMRCFDRSLWSVRLLKNTISSSKQKDIEVAA
jgi:hypothetical protein